MNRPINCYIEISGKCNARCPYCVKGSGSQAQGRFMPPEDFDKVLSFLGKNNLFPQSGCLGLYNWGEPLLHPQINEILCIAGSYGLRVHLSSNFLYLPKLTKESLLVIKGMTFSLSGFSQESYGRIHGRSLQQALNNFESLINLIEQAGCNWRPFVNWHRYRFNEKEMQEAKRYFSQRRISFTPTVAHFNDIHRTIEFLTNGLDQEQVRIIECDLFTEYLIDSMKKSSDKHYECPQWSMLSLNERCEVLLCCGWSDKVKGTVIGNVFDVELDNLGTIKRESPLCKQCNILGIAKWMHNQHLFSLDYFVSEGSGGND